MQYVLYILLAILLFGLLIAVHEFGHFFTAKLLGVKVNEFSIGMGPLLLRKTKGETDYSLRLLPIGGYCAMEGEDEATGDPRSFECQAPWKKFIILVAGSGMNFLAGLVMILLVFSQVSYFSLPVITEFMDGAEHLVEQGLQEGDQFYSIDGHRIYMMSDASLFLGRAGDTVDLKILRDGEILTFEDFDFSAKVPYTNEDGTVSYMRGIYYGQAVEATLWRTLQFTWYQAIDCVRLVWISLGDLITGTAGLSDLSGPIGIVDTVGSMGASASSTAEGLLTVLNVMALIAINLAVMNLLPIPALDGGRIFFLIVGLLYRLILRRKLNPKYERWINMAGFALLMGLMVVVAVSDVLKIAT
ncbi:MAG: M50 family metallopeptidase [Oscillospiraceae bacterium]|nr:M50 family metallopeptidase [Oscillospiraceae bacterium]